MGVFRPLFWRKSFLWPISTQWTPPSVIHGWKATGLLFMMVKRKKYFQHPISRQNFANAFAETPNLNLEVRRMSFYHVLVSVPGAPGIRDVCLNKSASWLFRKHYLKLVLIFEGPTLQLCFSNSFLYLWTSIKMSGNEGWLFYLHLAVMLHLVVMLH